MTEGSFGDEMGKIADGIRADSRVYRLVFVALAAAGFWVAFHADAWFGWTLAQQFSATIGFATVMLVWRISVLQMVVQATNAVVSGTVEWGHRHGDRDW